jgi:hypothetical protein
MTVSAMMLFSAHDNFHKLSSRFCFDHDVVIPVSRSQCFGILGDGVVDVHVVLVTEWWWATVLSLTL